MKCFGVNDERERIESFIRFAVEESQRAVVDYASVDQETRENGILIGIVFKFISNCLLCDIDVQLNSVNNSLD